MNIHEAANIFPMMSEADFQALKADISVNGLREPVWICGGKILDGRNRAKACDELGLDFDTQIYGGDNPVGFVISLNLCRRHLTASQKAMAALAIEEIEAKLAKERQLRKPVGLQIDEQNKGRADEKAAKQVGVSRAYVSDAKKIQAERPDLADQVRSGEKTITQAKREIKVHNIQTGVRQQIEVPTGRYGVVYADPPWQYDFSKAQSRQIENQYPTMALDKICALPLSDFTADDCVLFLWATSPKLAQAFDVIDAWGFNYLTCAVWAKPQIGMGYYFRQQHELLLVAAKGSPPAALESARVGSVHTEKRGKHSEKPAWFRDAVAAMYPHVPRIELFARQPAEGWKAWGNQVAA